jgi:tetratricopeptide (TPR) repeat protein
MDLERFAEAAALFEAVKVDQESRHGRASAAFADASVDLCICQRRGGNFDASVAAGLEALDACDAIHDEKRASHVEHNIALSQFQRREFAEAERLFSSSIAFNERQPSVDRASLGFQLMNLSTSISMQGRGEEARVTLVKAIGELKAGLPAADPRLVTAARNLASLLERIGKPYEAESLLNRTLAEARKHHEMTSPVVNGLLQNLIATAIPNGNLRYARQLTKELRAIGREVRETDPTVIAAAYDAAGHIAGLSNQPERAVRIYKKLVKLAGEAYGPASQNVAHVRIDLARMLISTDNWAAARKQVLRALQSYKALSETETVGHANSYHLLASITAEVDQPKALRLFARSLAIHRSLVPTGREPEFPRLARPSHERHGRAAERDGRRQ